jgi:NAD-dependent DNA ligase
MDYDLDSDACFLKDGDEINLEEIVPGAKVRIKIEDKKVVEIEVLDDLNITIDGRIIKFNEEKYRLTLEINGRKYSYDVSKKLDIIDNKKTGKKLTEMEGYWIKAYLVDGEVSKIEIL